MSVSKKPASLFIVILGSYRWMKEMSRIYLLTQRGIRGARVQSAQLSPEPAHIRREARMHRPRLPRLSGSSAFSFPPKRGQLFAGSLAWQRNQTRTLTARLPRRARRPTPLPFQKSGGQTGSQFSRPRPRTRGELP